MQPLSARALNRALLARQSLLERRPGDIPDLLRSMGFLQAQYAPSMYVGTWSRLARFARDDLTRDLEQRRIVQGTLLRSTIHLVAADDYWPVALAVREARRVAHERATKGVPGVDALRRAADTLRAELAERGPLTEREIDALVGRDRRTGVGLWLDLVRVPPAGTWERRRANVYAAAEDWLGPPPPGLDVDAATDLVVRRYLTGFGPATPAEIASWAGLPAATVRAALDRLPLRRLHAEDGPALVDLPDAPLPDPATPAPARYLPTWDAVLLTHARRTQVLPEQHRPRVFTTRNPQSVGTVLVDGRVVGGWWWRDGRVEVEEYERLDQTARRDVAAEGERLADLHR